MFQFAKLRQNIEMIKYILPDDENVVFGQSQTGRHPFAPQKVHFRFILRCEQRHVIDNTTVIHKIKGVDGHPFIFYK